MKQEAPPFRAGWFTNINTEGNIVLLSLGKVTAAKGISVVTAMSLLTYLQERASRELRELEILYQAMDTEDGHHPYIPMSQAEHWKRVYETEMKGRIGHISGLSQGLKEIFDRGQIPIFREAKNMKAVLLLQDWIQGASIKELEVTYRTYAGTIIDLARDVGWIIDAMAALSHHIGNDETITEGLKELVLRLELGIREEHLALAKLRVKGLGRREIFRLAQGGFSDLNKLAQATVNEVARFVPYKLAEELIGRVKTPEPSKPIYPVEGSPRLNITGNTLKKKSEIRWDDLSIFLSNRSFEILLRLAINRVTGGEGWVHKMDITKNDSASQLIFRLKKELSKEGVQEETIENDGAGCYRLKLDAQEIAIQRELLKNHWSAIVRQLAID